MTDTDIDTNNLSSLLKNYMVSQKHPENQQGYIDNSTIQDQLTSPPTPWVPNSTPWTTTTTPWIIPESPDIFDKGPIIQIRLPEDQCKKLMLLSMPQSKEAVHFMLKELFEDWEKTQRFNLQLLPVLLGFVVTTLQGER